MRRRDVLVGAGAAAVVFGAVPAVLAVAAGWPLPRHFDRVSLLAWRGLFDLLAVVAWLAWAACAWPVVRDVAKRVRARDVAARPGDRLLDRVALRIAVAILALAPAIGAASAAGASGTGPARHRPSAEIAAIGPASPQVVPPTVPTGGMPATTVPATTTTTAAPDTSGAAVPGTTTAPGDATPATGTTSTATGTTSPTTEPTTDLTATVPVPASSGPGPVGATSAASTWTVRSGDSLWSIAAAVYGDGDQWPLIAQANLDRVMDDGLTFTDPSLILPGWELSVPAATGTTGTTGVAGTTGAVVSIPVADATTAADAAADTGEGGPVPLHPPARSSHPSPRVRAVPGRGDAPAHRGGAPAPDHVPEIAVAGLGVLLAALLARRIRRERRLASFLRGEGQPTATLTPAVTELATSVDGLADLPLVELIESAWYRLGAAGPHDPGDAGVDRTPGVHLVRATPAGVELRGVADHSPCPEGWRDTGQSTWWFDGPFRAGVPGARHPGAAPWRALLLPLGENDDGEWLVALGAGARLSVIGPGADGVIGAMAVAARSWSWNEDVVVTATATVAASRSGTLGTTGPADSAGTDVLFTGDPRGLATGVGDRCATLTAEPVPSDLVVVVDERGATVHPLGLVLRPHRLNRAGALAVGQLVDGPAAPGTPYTPDDRPPALVTADARVTARLDPGSDNHARRPATARAHLPVVRLLTPVARIDGLDAPIDPKRVRRSVELVAYLGVWHPQPVTGERLRARVLGTADADAAAKTLFNTAGAARRALGIDDQGEPLLPLASRSGHYRLSPEVTVDAVRAADLLTRAVTEADGATGAVLVAQALSLVEGEPLGGTLNGYGWWRGEGHERRLSDLVVDGACRLARRCVETGDLDRARWAVDRARTVEPYSEALARAAMVVAAATGDAGRLQREWDDCRRLMDELDPGGVPSDATERLYDLLRRQLSEGRPAIIGG